MTRRDAPSGHRLWSIFDRDAALRQAPQRNSGSDAPEIQRVTLRGDVPA